MNKPKTGFNEFSDRQFIGSFREISIDSNSNLPDVGFASGSSLSLTSSTPREIALTSPNDFAGEHQMAQLTGLTLGGLDWEPKFVSTIDQSTCLGCGRCFKVCGRNVLALKAMNEDGEFIDEEDEEDEEIERKVMTIARSEYCIGCQACSRICPKNCYTHEPLAV